MYNANIELKDYAPKRGLYMAKARRKTTIDERKEIVNYYAIKDYTVKSVHKADMTVKRLWKSETLP